MEENKSSGNRAMLILLALLLLGSLAGNFMLYKAKGTNEVVIQEKDVVIDSLVDARVSVETELNTTMMELESYRGKNEELDKLLNEAQDKLKQREGKIRSMLKDKKGMDKMVAELKAELEEIKKIKDQYLDKIDALTLENEQLKGTITMISQKADSLQGEISSASSLKVEYVKVKTSKLRYNGKAVETGLARRTEKFEVDFSVMDNKLAKAGEHTAYVRVLQPDGNVLGELGKFTIKSTGMESGYTGAETFNYDKSKKDFHVDFTDEKYRFQKGTYIVEIYIDGNLHTSGYYELK
jgi:myosin heavy subunit